MNITSLRRDQGCERPPSASPLAPTAQVRSAHGKSAVSVLELVALLAVTTAMGALVFSMYRTHAIRAEVSAGIAAALEVAPLVAYAFERHAQVPADNEAAAVFGLWESLDGTVVRSLRVVNGRIDVVYGGAASTAISGRQLSLTPYESATGEIVWICGNAIPGVGLRPLGFSVGGPQPVQPATTLEGRYLPRKCR